MKHAKGLASILLALALCWPVGGGCAEVEMVESDGGAGRPYTPTVSDGTGTGEGSVIRQDLEPVEFLGMLRKQGRGVYVIRGWRKDWISAEDVVQLLALVDDPTPCVAVVSWKSSIRPKGSTVGKEALYLVTGFNRGSYPSLLHAADQRLPGKVEVVATAREKLAQMGYGSVKAR